MDYVSHSFRGDYLGADDVWRKALRWDSHTGDSRHLGEGRAFAPAAHLHHRRLHGDGQM